MLRPEFADHQNCNCKYSSINKRFEVSKVNVYGTETRESQFKSSNGEQHKQQRHSAISRARHIRSKNACVCVPPNSPQQHTSTDQHYLRARHMSVTSTKSCRRSAISLHKTATRKPASPSRMSCKDNVEAYGCSHKRSTNVTSQIKQCIQSLRS